MGDAKDIIIFTQFYPYTYFDAYFERELFELSKHYARIFLISANTDSTVVKPIPGNTKAFRFSPVVQRQKKLLLLRHLFAKDFLRELIHMIKMITFGNFITAVWYALSSFERSDQYRKFLEKLIKEKKISESTLTIYCYWMLEYAYAAGKMKKHSPQMKVIVRAHRFDLYFDENPIGYLPLKMLTFEKANAIFFISEHGRNYFATFHQIKGEALKRLKVARLGIPAATDVHIKDTRDKALFSIVSNSYVLPHKRVDLIAAALKEISDLRIEWIHFGDVHKQTEAFELFKNRVYDELKEHPNIHIIFKGGVTNDEILSFYQNNFVDLFINVSSSEGIPVSIMEAFSFGIPVIATAAGGTPEIVNNENGRLLPADVDKITLAQSIRNYLVLSVPEKEKFRRSAFNTWKEKFNADVNYPKFVEEILSL